MLDYQSRVGTIARNRIERYVQALSENDKNCRFKEE